jgi:hypothetical protein
MTQTLTKQILEKRFDTRNVDAFLKYAGEATGKYITEDFDGVALKAGKFVEAVTKALLVHCGKPLPDNARKFKAGVELKALENLGAFSDTIRIVIPKACIFIYEIVNNRGGRHDSAGIDANEMDARVIIPLLSWILAEMVRFCSDASDTNAAMRLIDGITNKIYPFFEDIDGRTYVNLEKTGAPEVALLLLYSAYPKAVRRTDLIDSIVRHRHKTSAANMAVRRMSTLYDEADSMLTLRATGRLKAEDLMQRLQSKRQKK